MTNSSSRVKRSSCDVPVAISAARAEAAASPAADMTGRTRRVRREGECEKVDERDARGGGGIDFTRLAGR